MSVGRTCAKCQAVNGHTYSHCAGCGELLPPVFIAPHASNVSRNRAVAIVAVTLMCSVFLAAEILSIHDEEKAVAASAKAEREEKASEQRERDKQAAIAQAQADAVKRQREELSAPKLLSVDEVNEQARLATHSTPKGQ